MIDLTLGRSAITQLHTNSATCSAWASYLAEFTWSFFVTLTTSVKVGRDRLVREFRRLIHRLERIAKAPVMWFYSIEEGEGRAHIHALLWQEHPLPTRAIESQWRLGIAKAARFDPSLPGAAYIAKEIGADVTDAYDLSPNLPPRAQGAPTYCGEKGGI